MLEEIQLKNCPAEYFLNCKNYETRCHECKGNAKGKYLLYSPINKDINKHPANIVQKSKTVSYSKLGKTKERKLIEHLPFFNSTVCSGSINGDGDASLYLPNIGKLKVEIKCRFKATTTYLPSLKEHRESYTQNIKLIIIHLVNNKHSYFYLDFKTFVIIWKTLISSTNILELHNFKYLKKGLFGYLFTPYNTTNLKIASSHFFGVQEVKKFTIDYFDTSFCYVYTNKVGSYVAMSEPTFFELIYLYKYVSDLII